MQCNGLECHTLALPVSMSDTELYYIILNDLSLANSMYHFWADSIKTCLRITTSIAMLVPRWRIQYCLKVLRALLCSFTMLLFDIELSYGH